MARLDRPSLGKHGEDVACRELGRRGYAILARRFRTRFGEIDIIARDGRTLVFIEVKTRSSAAFGTPAEAVTARKQAKIGLMASEYLLRRGATDLPCRFDVVGVAVEEGKAPVVELIRGAFDAIAFRR
jgi:putative endonuclease